VAQVVIFFKAPVHFFRPSGRRHELALLFLKGERRKSDGEKSAKLE
jgi:hypothetical protein